MAGTWLSCNPGRKITGLWLSAAAPEHDTLRRDAARE
jgi:hypothetical protein